MQKHKIINSTFSLRYDPESVKARAKAFHEEQEETLYNKITINEDPEVSWIKLLNMVSYLSIVWI